jgi:hypothetical protein
MKARHFIVILFQATNKDTGIIKVVNKININAIPSTPKITFQFIHNLTSTKHWNQSLFKLLSNKPHNSNDTKNTTALTSKVNARTKFLFHETTANIKAPKKGSPIKLDKIFIDDNIKLSSS